MNGASASRQRHAPPDNRPPDNSLAPPAPSPPRKRPQTAGGASARGAVTREGGYETTAPPRPPRRGRQGGKTTETQRGAGNKNGRVRVEGAACAPSHNGGRRLVHQRLAREREGEDRLGWGRRCGEWAARAPQAVARSRPNGWRAIIRPARCLSRATERPCSVRAARKRGTNVSAAGGHRPTRRRGGAHPPSPLLPPARSRGAPGRQHPLRCRATRARQTRWVVRLRWLRRRLRPGGTSPVPPPFPLRTNLARGARPQRIRTASVARWRCRPHGRGAECRRHRISQPSPSQPC